jgi:hypothetical protein
LFYPKNIFGQNVQLFIMSAGQLLQRSGFDHFTVEQNQ